MAAPLNVRWDAIALDVSIQCRAAIDTAVVREYAEALTEGATFPPITLYEAAGKHCIGDGCHRVMASKPIGTLDIAATVEPGGRAAAVKHALGANAAHGHRRTNADKRRAVDIALREFPKMSNMVVAKMCGVGDGLVRALRQVPENVTSTVTRADGKQYPARKPKSEEYVTVTCSVTQPEPATVTVAAGQPQAATTVTIVEPGTEAAARMHPSSPLERLKTLTKLEGVCTLTSANRPCAS